MINYESFKSILNEKIFGEDKLAMITKISESPERYIGLFRPTKPRAKLFQNLLQSHEIRFGDSLEMVTRKIIEDLSYQILPRTITSSDNKTFNVDQLFKKRQVVYFVEQKVRDDHDSSKKDGQINNFEKKLNVLLSLYKDSNLIGIMHFIDPDLTKNKRYYVAELQKLAKDYGIKTYLLYGKDFFEFLGVPDCWDLLLDYLTRWKKDIPDFPEINFDNDPKDTFDKLKDIKPLTWRKFVNNNKLWEEGIVQVIFSTGQSLRLIQKYFQNKDHYIYGTLSQKLAKNLRKYYH